MIEVLSTTRRLHDRTVKVGWYRQYGVRECWIADPIAQSVEVIDLIGPVNQSRLFAGDQYVQSPVLPRLRLRAAAVFAD